MNGTIVDTSYAIALNEKFLNDNTTQLNLNNNNNN